MELSFHTTIEYLKVMHLNFFDFVTSSLIPRAYVTMDIQNDCSLWEQDCDLAFSIQKQLLHLQVLARCYNSKKGVNNQFQVKPC